MKAALFTALAFASFIHPLTARPAIRVLAIYGNAYTGDAAGINESVNGDRLLINNLLTENFSEASWGATLVITEVVGPQANRDLILQSFNEVTKGMGIDDVLYVHFSGHGSIPDAVSGEQMLETCDDRQVSRKHLAETMAALNCRLKVLITDCCSTYSNVPVAEGDEEVQPWKSMYSLLMRHKGFVDITAASPGEAAWGTQVGGYLTVNLHSDMQRYSSWTQVFAEARSRVMAETKRVFNEVQTPLAYSLGEKMDGGAPGWDKAPDFILPQSDERLLTVAELSGMSLMQLYLARNEIAARHGHDFSTPMLQRYFSTKQWYQRSTGQRDVALSTIEDENAQMILQAERALGGPFVGRLESDPRKLAAMQGAPDIFPYSSQKHLTRSIVESLSGPQLSIARNEVFARHGMIFQTPALKQYFSSKPDYSPNPAFDDSQLNDVEQQNLWLIEKIERIRGGPYKW